MSEHREVKIDVLTDEDGVGVEFGSWFDWWSIYRDEDNALHAAVRVAGSSLDAVVTPKQARTIGRALIKLADEAAPLKVSKPEPALTKKQFRKLIKALDKPACDGWWLH